MAFLPCIVATSRSIWNRGTGTQSQLSDSTQCSPTDREFYSQWIKEPSSSGPGSFVLGQISSCPAWQSEECVFRYLHQVQTQVLHPCYCSFWKCFPPRVCLVTSFTSLMWKLLSHVQLFATPQTVAHQIYLSMEFSRPEYWSSSCSLLQGILPTQGSNPGLPLCRQILYQSEPPGKPSFPLWLCTNVTSSERYPWWHHVKYQPTSSPAPCLLLTNFFCLRPSALRFFMVFMSSNILDTCY